MSTSHPTKSLVSGDKGTSLLFIILASLLLLCGCSKKVADTSLPERYAQFLSCFSDSTCYALESISGQEVLLVSSEVFTEDSGNQQATYKAIAAQLYTLDSKGQVVCLGEVRSQGTGYPLALSGGTLLTAGHHFVTRYEVSGTPASLSIQESAEESFDSNGNATYSYENRQTDEYSSPSDNQKLTMLFDEFEEAETILFKPCHAATTAETAGERNTLVCPLPSGLDMDNLKDATISVSFTSDDFRWMGGNLTMTVYAEQLYDATDLHQLQTGDSILFCGDTLLVSLMEDKEGEISINGGFENDGITLWPSEGGTFRAVEYDDHSVYAELGEVELPLSDDFTIVDCHEDPQESSDTIRTGQKLYLENLKDSRRQFSFLDTTVEIKGGVITNITRRWIP